ncbi:MAG: sugar phosphate isomerase/epimerase, partial [Chloroflexi bacterium]|nr:sugar phosphate isomerase/epimerase [Chloroflexota bacterium]
VKLGVENHPEKTPDALLRKMGEDDEDVIGATVDTGWFGTQSYDAARAIEELGERLVLAHLKDVREVGTHHTCRYGDGIVPLRACVETLQRIGYTGAISVEHEPETSDPTEDIKASYAMLREWLG